MLPRHSADFRAQPSNGTIPGANGNGAVPVPAVPHNRLGNGHPPNIRGMGFDGPRSPPNNKSTSHVPCKFYRQGACQAGKACPFLHSDEPLTERAPCKYFTKGNCKFGGKCALAHVLPDGRVVNRPSIGAGGGHLNLGGRVNLPHHPEPAPGSSLLTMQAHMAPLQQPNYQYSMQDEYFGTQPHQKPHYDMIPTIDTTFSSHPGSNYGSPPNESGRMPMSPVQKGLSVLDAPLPASFDSQGISHMARYGPLAASVPSRFGLESSPPSSFQQKAIGDSPALRNLHNSAFGDDSRNGKNGMLASSPPDSTEQPFGRRIMHSERFSKSKNMISVSLGSRAPLTATDDWDEENFAFEEDLVPNALHDLLTEKEKMRRFSRDDGNSLSHRHSLSGLGASPADSNSKVGSPSAATSSPSRFTSLWGRSRPNEGGIESGSLPGVSAFGHVGSPLRNSSLHPGASPSIRAVSRPTSGDVSPFVSSPPRQASMSMISQQLQRTRLSSRASEGSEGSGLSGNSALHPGLGMGRMTSGGSSVGNSAGGRLGMDRAVSSSSIGRERIEEEQGLFSMEEEEELEKEREKRKDGPTAGSAPGTSATKRFSGPWGLTTYPPESSSPNLGPIGGQRSAGGNVGSLGKDGGVWGNGT